MKFIVSSSFLKAKLAPLFPTVNNSTVLPILESFFIEADKDKKTVTFEATDLENIFIVELKDVEVGASGRVCVDARRIRTLIKCEDQPLTFSCDANFVVTVIGVQFKIKLTGENSDNWPKRPTLDIKSHGTYDTKDLFPVLRKASIFCSNDDLRPAMTGVFVHEREGKLWIVGTDAHRLFYKELHMPTTLRYKFPSTEPHRDTIFTGMSFVMPKKAVILLTQLKAEQVKIEWDINRTLFTVGDYTLYSRNIDARYPNYTAVIPKPDFQFSLNRKEAISFIKIAEEFANVSTKQMKLIIDPKTENIQLTTEDIDFSMSFDCSLRAYNMKMEEPLTIAFNARFILENLRQEKDEYVLIQHCGSSTKAIIIDNHILTMPLMLNE